MSFTSPSSSPGRPLSREELTRLQKQHHDFAHEHPLVWLAGTSLGDLLIMFWTFLRVAEFGDTFALILTLTVHLAVTFRVSLWLVEAASLRGRAWRDLEFG